MATKQVKRVEDLAVSVRELSRSFVSGVELLPVLTRIDFDLKRGKSLAVVGESGSGKSTLLNLIGGLDYASSGSIKVFGTAIDRMTESELARFRNRNIGFVFQYHHLLPDFSALENAALPAILAGVERNQAFERARDLLRTLGLVDRDQHRPGQLSGGEQQRVAIARALVNHPGLVLMDEPTGNLDEANGAGVLRLVKRLQKQLSLSMILVTHSQRVARACDHCLELSGGEAKKISLTKSGSRAKGK